MLVTTKEVRLSQEADFETGGRGSREQTVGSGLRLRAYGVEPVGGHGGMFLYDLAYFQALAKQGVDVVWATCDETDVRVGAYELWTPFRGIYGGQAAWRRGLRYALGLWRVLRRAKREARDRPLVIDQQFSTVPIIDYLFTALAQFLGIPCVLTVHDVIPYESSAARRQHLPRLYRKYDALVVHSQWAQGELQALLGSDSTPVYFIPHGHYNDSHGNGPSILQDDARSLLNLPLGSRVILFLGQIKREKGLEHLLQALPTVLERCPDALLVVAGRPWRADVAVYESLIDQLGVRDSVRVWWEYVPDGDLPLYYRAADVVALPYTRVYQSGVCLTAYAFARPVVASAVGGLTEQVRDGDTGVLVPPGDPRALAGALSMLLRDPKRAEVMGQQGRRWAGEAFDWDRIARQTIRVYRDVWQNRHGPSSDPAPRGMLPASLDPTARLTGKLTTASEPGTADR